MADITHVPRGACGTLPLGACCAQPILDGDGNLVGMTIDGVPHNIDPDNSVITPIVLAGNAIANHGDGDGVISTIFESITGLSYDGATGVLTYTDEAGNDTVINLPLENFLSAAVYNDTTNILTLTLVDGMTFDVDLNDLVDPETTTTLVDNGDGTFTYTSEDGTVTTVQTNNSTLTANADGSYTHDDGNGTTVTITAPVPETVTTLADNGDGTFTYTSENGTATTIDVNSSTLTANADGSFTHDDGGGNTTVIPAPVAETVTTLLANADGSYTYTSENGTTTTIPAHIPSSLTANADGSFTHNDGVGNTVTIPVPASGAKSSLTEVVNADGTKTYTHSDGDTPAVTQDFCTGAKLTDSHGSEAVVDCAGLVTHRTIDVGQPLHTNSAGSNFLQVAHADSHSADVVDVTTRHNHTVISAQASSALGIYSLASGGQNSAGGSYSQSFGRQNIVSNAATAGFAANYQNEVNASYSAAFGRSNEVDGSMTVAFGNANDTTAIRSLITGYFNDSSGDANMVAGRQNISNDDFSLIGGGQLNRIGTVPANGTATGRNAIVNGRSNRIDSGADNVIIGSVSSEINENTAAGLSSIYSAIMASTGCDLIGGRQSAIISSVNSNHTHVGGNGYGTMINCSSSTNQGNTVMINDTVSNVTQSSTDRRNTLIHTNGVTINDVREIVAISASGNITQQDIVILGKGSVDVAIGANTATEKLHVHGNILATGTITPSDKNFKKDIKLVDSALDKITKLRGVEYKWKKEFDPKAGEQGEGRVLGGVIAQEVKEVIPHVVIEEHTKNKYVKEEVFVKRKVKVKTGEKEIEVKSINEKGEGFIRKVIEDVYEYKEQEVSAGFVNTKELEEKGKPTGKLFVDYQSLTPYLIESIKELKQIVDNQSKEIAALQKKS